MSEPRCLECNREVRLRDPLVLHEVVGFARPRQQGGQNHVRFREATGRYLCQYCAAKRQYGTAEQGALFS